MQQASLYLLVSLLFFSGIVYGQVIQDDELDDVAEQIIYNRERTGNITAHNLGFALSYKPGRNINAFTTTVLNIELLTMKSPKQVKIINPYYNNSKRYVYGKLNDVFILRGGYGVKKLLNQKPYWGGIELRWLLEGGASIAFQKPYYYFVINIEQGINGNLVIDTKRYNESTTSTHDIYGRAPFTKGLGEISLRPGLYFKSGFNFEFGYTKTQIKAAEVGAVIEFYPQGVTILADNMDQKFFLTFYISFGFGKRFNFYR
ncbi:MAG: hypothetical protein PHG67_03515 [Bacteroidales bacterium]|nr:hypothetical protein [Bacteroidales bacterium]